MKQYLELLTAIKERGTYKPAAREGMPGTKSLFGYQFRHNLQDGFPLLTTKKMFWKGVVIELLWFLRGDTNIKYLIDNGVNIWNEDAYQYYVNKCKRHNLYKVNFETFIEIIKDDKSVAELKSLHDGMIPDYKFGDCGYQYGKVWRAWKHEVKYETLPDGSFQEHISIDQIKNVIHSLKTNPQGRRHIVTAIDPSNENNLALYWCHAMFQFNCRPIDEGVRTRLLVDTDFDIEEGENKIPKYYLDCQLYQRSADVFLGVPFNIASYALLTHIIAKICNMIPGDFVHTFGDVHIYDTHKEQVEEQLKREPILLPQLGLGHFGLDINEINSWDLSDFELKNYQHYPNIKAELSTGLKK